MFGDPNAGSGDDEGDDRRNIKGAPGVAAGAAGIDQRFGENFVAGGKNRGGVAAHGGGEADDFVNGFAFRAQGEQERRDLVGGDVAGENRFHDAFGFHAR